MTDQECQAWFGSTCVVIDEICRDLCAITGIKLTDIPTTIQKVIHAQNMDQGQNTPGKFPNTEIQFGRQSINPRCVPVFHRKIMDPTLYIDYFIDKNVDDLTKVLDSFYDQLSLGLILAHSPQYILNDKRIESMESCQDVLNAFPFVNGLFAKVRNVLKGMVSTI